MSVGVRIASRPPKIIDGVTITYTKSHTYITHTLAIDGVTTTYTESYANPLPLWVRVALKGLKSVDDKKRI